MSDVTIYWRPGCPYCDRLERTLGVHADEATWVNIWEDDDAREFVASVNGGNEVVPTVVIDGEAHTNPSPKVVKAALDVSDSGALPATASRKNTVEETPKMASMSSSSTSSLSRDEVAHVASLARIQLSEEELDTFAAQFGSIVDFVASVGEVAADDIPPMSHPLPLVNVTRPDEVRTSLTAEEALEGAPASEQQRFLVPRILDED